MFEHLHCVVEVISECVRCLVDVLGCSLCAVVDLHLRYVERKSTCNALHEEKAQPVWIQTRWNKISSLRVVIDSGLRAAPVRGTIDHGWLWLTVIIRRRPSSIATSSLQLFPFLASGDASCTHSRGIVQNSIWERVCGNRGRTGLLIGCGSGAERSRGARG